jgi:hypothetical protein
MDWIGEAHRLGEALRNSSYCCYYFGTKGASSPGSVAECSSFALLKIRPQQLDGVDCPWIAVVDLGRLKVVLFVSQSASLGWLFLAEVWVVVLLFSQGARGRDPFARRLDQLLVVLVPQAATGGRGTKAALRQEASRAFGRPGALGGLRGSARRWRAQLRAVCAQGHQVASETISSPAEVGHGGELVRETIAALKAERARGGVKLPTTEDPVVVLAYGLGAWPSGADLTSLEQLLVELGVSQPVLRGRFESLIRTIPTASQNRQFRELAGASFVLGAAARIIEAADPPARSVPPPGWLATIKAHLR